MSEYNGPPGLSHPYPKKSKRSSFGDSEKNRRSSRNINTMDDSKTVQIKLQSNKFDRSRAKEAARILGRKRQHSPTLGSEPPRKKMRGEVPKRKVIGAVRQQPGGNGWQVRTAQGIILEEIFSTKEEAEAVLRNSRMESGFHNNPSQGERGDKTRNGSNNPSQPKRTITISQTDLDDDNLFAQPTKKQIKKNRENLQKWKLQKLQARVSKNLKSAHIDLDKIELQPESPKKRPSPKTNISPVRRRVDPPPRKKSGIIENILRKAESNASYPSKHAIPAEIVREPLFPQHTIGRNKNIRTKDGGDTSSATSTPPAGAPAKRGNINTMHPHRRTSASGPESRGRRTHSVSPPSSSTTVLHPPRTHLPATVEQPPLSVPSTNPSSTLIQPTVTKSTESTDSNDTHNSTKRLSSTNENTNSPGNPTALTTEIPTNDPSSTNTESKSESQAKPESTQEIKKRSRSRSKDKEDRKRGRSRRSRDRKRRKEKEKHRDRRRRRKEKERERRRQRRLRSSSSELEEPLKKEKKEKRRKEKHDSKSERKKGKRDKQASRLERKKTKEKEKERDRDRERERNRERDRDKDKRRARGERKHSPEDDEPMLDRTSRSRSPVKREVKKEKRESGVKREAKVRDSKRTVLDDDVVPRHDRTRSRSPVRPPSTPATTKPATPSKLALRRQRSPSPFPPELAFATWNPATQGSREFEKCYTTLNTISEGVYGVVHRCKDKETGELMALKKIKLYKTRSGFPKTSLREIGILLGLDHINIVRVKEIVVSITSEVYMVMDYCHNDLQYLLQKKVQFTTPQVKSLMRDLLAGVAHMHEKWFLHRDLKTANLLYTHSGVLKICDFGMARQYGFPLDKYTSHVVTPWYRSVELLLGTETYGPAVDVWSIGCIFSEIFTGRVLFEGGGELQLLNLIYKVFGTPNKDIWPDYPSLPHINKFQFVQSENRFRERFPVSTVGIFDLCENVQDLMENLLRYDPKQRVSCADALTHPWFSTAPFPAPHTEMPCLDQYKRVQKEK